MFCPKCGRELVAQAKFCAHCGANIQSLVQQPEEVPSAPQENGPEVRSAISTETVSPGDTYDSDYLAAAVGTNQAYYLPEFQKIQAGEKSRFNWAAFLFGSVFCFYRKSGDLFKRFFLPSTALGFVGYLIIVVGTVPFNLIAMTAGVIISAIADIWQLVNMIRFGKQFNQLYYERCSSERSNADKCGTSTKAVCLFLLAIIVPVLVINIGSRVAARLYYSSLFDPDIYGTVNANLKL